MKRKRKIYFRKKIWVDNDEFSSIKDGVLWTKIFSIAKETKCILKKVEIYDYALSMIIIKSNQDNYYYFVKKFIDELDEYIEDLDLNG